MLIILILVASIGLAVFALLALLLFVKTKRFVLGTVLAVLSILLLLADIKMLQFRKMGASRPTMPPPTGGSPPSTGCRSPCSRTRTGAS